MPSRVDLDRQRRPCAPGPAARRPGPGRPAAAGRCRGPGPAGRPARRAAAVLQPRRELPDGGRDRRRHSASRPSWMVSATSCCCAPSCRFRSIFRRSASCASTSRRREARRSSIVASQFGGQRARCAAPGPPATARCASSLSSAAGQRLVRRLVQGQRAEQLAAVPDGYRPACAGSNARAGPPPVPSGRRGGVAIRAARSRPGRSSRADPDPRLGPVRAGRPGQHRHHPVDAPR